MIKRLTPSSSAFHFIGKEKRPGGGVAQSTAWLLRWLQSLIACLFCVRPRRAILFSTLAAALTFRATGVELAPGVDFQQALDRAAPGDTIALPDGVYYQSLVITHGGTPGKPITLKAVRGGGATLSGALPTAEAKLKFVRVDEEPGMYKAAVPHRVWWVMVEGRNLANYGYYSYLKTLEFPDQSNGALQPCVPEGFAWRNGQLFVRLEKKVDPNTVAIEINRAVSGHTSTEPEFAKETRWAPDSGFDVPGAGHFFSRFVGNIIVKADHVVIEGLRLHLGVGAAVVVHGNDVTVRDCYMTGAHIGICQPDEVKLAPGGKGPRLITPYQRTGRGLTVEYCEFNGTPGYESCRRGFWGGLYAANTSMVFMNYGGPRSIVRNNWVYDSSQDLLQPRGNGTSAPEDASEIAYNLLQNCGDDSIEFDSASPMNLRVHHNFILDGMCLMSLCPVMGGGLTIDHNLFYNSPEAGSRNGCWIKLGSPWGSALPTIGMRLIHNTVVQTHDTFQWCGEGHRYESNLLENNIIYVAKSQEWGMPDFVLSRHNLYCGPKINPQHIPLLIHADPPFVSMKPMNFNLRPDSAAVDTGAAGKDQEYVHKSAGKAPDLGAIELGETWNFPRPGPRWAKGKEIPNRPAIPASLPLKWVGLE